MNNSRFKLYLIVTLVLSGLLPIIGSTFLHLFLLDRYWIDEPLHSVFEALGSFIALSLAILTLLLQKDKRIPSYYMWVSCALIGMGILDGFHAFSPPGDSFVWLHGMAVLVGGFLFAMVWLPDRIVQSRPTRALYIVVAVVTFVLSVFAVYFPDTLPAMINKGVFTSVANTINMLGGLFFISAAVYFVIRYRSNHSHEDFLFANFCLLNGWAGLLFSFSQIWNADWWLWHVLRLAAYLTVLSYMFIAFQRYGSELKLHHEHLEELVQKRTTELKITNEQLHQEINERIRSDEKLRTVIARLGEEKSKTEAIIAAIGDGLIIQDTDFNIIYQNQVHIDLYGDHIGECCYKAFQGRDTICEGCPVELSFRDGQIHRAETTLATDRGVLYSELIGSPLRDSTGKIIAGIKVVRDITESKRLEEEKNRLLRAIASSTEGIAITDGEDRYIYVNAAHAMIYSYPQEELIGKTWREITQPEMIAPTETVLDNTLHNKEIGAFSGEFLGLRKDGTTIPTEARGKALWDEADNYQGHICIVRDITERKLMEEKLRRAHDELEIRVRERTSELAKANEALLESEASYRELAESIGEVFYALDRELRYTYWNSASEALIGILAKDAVGKSLFELFPELKGSRAEKLYMEVLKTQQSQHFVHRYRARDKDLFFEINAYPSKYGLSVIAKDITERKRIEKILQEREHSYRTLAENLPGIVYRVFLRENSRMQFFNNMVQPMTGFTEEELMAGDVCSLDALILPEDRADVITTVKRAVMDNQPFQVEYRLRHKKGVVRYFLERGRPINGTDGNPLYIDGVIFDITESKRAEEQIREQAELLDKAQDAITLWDLEHRLIYWNTGAVHLYGWTAKETIGKNADELLYKEESPQFIEAKKSVIEKGEWTGELHQITKDGKELIVESRWTLVHDGKGEPKSILIINTDITEKKKLESQFLRAQRMESIGTLAGGIAHDINNVLTPMMLSLQLLQEKFTDNESQKLLNVLERSTQRGASLVKQVQSFARGVEGEHVALQVSYLVSEITQIAKETFTRSIEIRTDIQKDLWTISGDATQLHQVIMNLCVNARDAMPEGGILSISAENIFIDKNYARMNIDAKIGQYVVITVSDTGTGIPSEILDRIFEPFFTTKQPGKGTGLGLSTSLAIVKSHSGFINVYSEVGKGTVFKVYLPVAKTTEVQKVDEQQLELLAGHGELILVVDDEAMVREISSSILESHGYRVLTANEGAEAINVYKQRREKIKVVLMDMMMPVMDGQACIKALREVNPDIKIIAVSGLAEKGKFAKVAVTQVKAFLPKPYVAKRLLKTIHEVISAK